MKTNIGTVDRSVRAVIALVIGGLYFTGMVTGTGAIVLAVVAVIFTLTSAAGSCPAYMPLGLDTRKGDGAG